MKLCVRVFHEKHRIYQHLNLVEILVNSGVNEKSEWTKIIQPNIPQYDEYMANVMNCVAKLIISRIIFEYSK